MPRHTTPPWLLLCGLLLLLVPTPPNQASAIGAAPAHAAARPAASVLAPSFIPSTTTPELGFVGGLGSVVETAVISGSLAYVGEYNTLVILDVSDSTQPVVLTRMPLTGEIKGLQAVGGLLYIANDLQCLQIVDVSDPLRPVLRSTLTIPGNPSDIAVVNGRAYIPAYNGGLEIIDVTNPVSPTLLGSSTESLGSVTGVKVVGDRAYIAGLGGLFIFDVSNPLSPHLLGSFNSVGHGGGNGYNLDVIDTLVYLADGGGGLQIIDVSNPASPQLRSALDLPIYSLAVQVSDGLAYIAGREGGLAIVDVSNPAAPIARGSFDTAGAAYDIQVLNGLAYVADYNDGLQVLDVTNPASPLVRGSYTIAGNTAKSWVEGNLAYVAAGSDGLRVIDVGTPGRPRVLGSLALPGSIASVQVVGDLAYLCDRVHDTFFIVDVSDPGASSLIGSYVIGQSVADVEVVGTLAYVASGGGGLRILDVSDPTAPTLRGSFATSGFAGSVDVVGNLAYVASEFGGLQIIDVSNPVSPTLRGSFAVPANTLATSVQVVGDFAYVTDRSSAPVVPFPPAPPADIDGGLLIIDISNPASPTLRGTFDAGTQANDVQVVDDRAYIAAGNQALVLNVSDPVDPQLLDSFATQGQAEGVRVVDGLIYVTGYLAGLQILSSSPELLSSATTITANGGQAASVDGSVHLRFSAGAVQDPLTVLYISQLHTAAALDGAGVAVRRFMAEGRARGGLAVAQTNQPYTMSVDYTDAQLAQLGIPEANLNLAYWDGGAWVNALPCAGCGIDLASNRVTVHMARLTQFALVGGAGPTPPPPPGPTVSPAGGHIDSFDGNVSLDFPAGAVTSTVTVTYTGLITPAQPLSDDQTVLHSFRLEARAGTGQPVTQFAQPFTMVISYTGAQLAALGVSEANLNLAYWDGGAWINTLPCAGCGVDIEHNRVTAVLDRFGEFALVANREHKVFVPLISR